MNVSEFEARLNAIAAQMSQENEQLKKEIERLKLQTVEQKPAAEKKPRHKKGEARPDVFYVWLRVPLVEVLGRGQRYLVAAVTHFGGSKHELEWRGKKVQASVICETEVKRLLDLMQDQISGTMEAFTVFKWYRTETFAKLPDPHLLQLSTEGLLKTFGLKPEDLKYPESESAETEQSE